jgi:HAD superfamily hydrolase (TIGR01484 family)
MKKLVAFDMDGTLALSKQRLDADMAGRLAKLLTVAKVAVISGGDWPQFEKQVVSQMPAEAQLEGLFIMPTSGTKMYRHDGSSWRAVYADLFTAEEKARIIAAFNASLEATGFKPEQTWGELIEDRGSQVTFSALGQQAPLEAKEHWDPDFSKRKVIQADLKQRLAGFAINLGGATSVDITREGVNKATGLQKLADQVGIATGDMIFIGDAIFPGGNDYPPFEAGIDCVKVKTIDDTRSAIDAIVICLQG